MCGLTTAPVSRVTLCLGSREPVPKRDTMSRSSVLLTSRGQWIDQSGEYRMRTDPRFHSRPGLQHHMWSNREVTLARGISRPRLLTRLEAKVRFTTDDIALREMNASALKKSASRYNHTWSFEVAINCISLFVGECPGLY
jgi:hypothetical protein